MGIGDTSVDIGTWHPLPINLLYAYLAKIAYQIGEFEIAKEAAEKNCRYFMEESEINERSLNYEKNPVVFWRLKQKSLACVSVIEIQSLTDSFIVSLN